MSKKLTLQDIVAKMPAKFADYYDFSNAVYVAAPIRITRIVCPEHGEFSQYSGQLMKGGAGCPKCGHAKVAASKVGKSSKLKGKASAWSKELFIERAMQKHGDLYDYSLVPEELCCTDKVRIVCKLHGQFLQQATAHTLGQGCRSCGISRRSTNGVISSEEWLVRFRETHGDTYIYHQGTIIGAQTKCVVTCRIHGDFRVSPNHHWGGKGCKQCADIKTANANRRTIESFIEQATLVHSGRYTYNNSHYTTARKKIRITCPVHGDFEQIAGTHLRGVGCAKCSVHESQGEHEIYEFMSTIDPDTVSRDRQLIKPYELDIYSAKHNLAVEYCGEYFHSDLVATDARTKHSLKFDLCRKAGLRLITVYESEWKSKSDVIKKVIRTAMGAVTERRFARKLDCVEIDIPTGRAFFANEHLQGAPRKGKFFGLFDGNELVACMAFALGASLRGDTTTWELLRYASSGQVVGGASKLFKHFCKAYSPESIVSFSDNRWFDGGMYSTLGFALQNELPPDYQVYSSRLYKLYHKSLFQRKVLTARAAEHGVDINYDPATDPRTERDITKLLRCGRIYDCGKKKWVWTKQP